MILYQNMVQPPEHDDIDLSRELFGAKVAFIRGFFGDIGHALGLIDYYTEQIDWLDAIGIASQRIMVHTQKSLGENSRIIAEYIGRQHSSLVIVAHSKGGIDLLEALLKNVELCSKILGVITIQVPFAGTDSVREILASSLLKRVYQFGISLTGGKMRALTELDPNSRRIYLSSHSEEIASTAKQLIWLNVTSSIQGEVSWLLARRKAYLDRLGMESDGIVPTAKMSLAAGSVEHIHLENIDHMETVSKNYPGCRKQNFSRIDFLRTLLWLVVSRCRETARPLGRSGFA